jgi:hypothetical protein
VGVIGMTFTYAGKPYVLQFVDGALNGLEVRCASMSFAEVVDIMGYDDLLRQAGSLAEVRDVVLSGPNGGLLGELTSRILETNAEVSNYRDFLLGMDFDDLMTVLKAWVRAISGQDSPLSEMERVEQEDELGLT